MFYISGSLHQTNERKEKTMKTRKLRVISGFVVAMLMLTVLATTALASSDFYESTYNGYGYTCRSTCVSSYCKGAMTSQSPSKLIIELTVRTYYDGTYYTNTVASPPSTSSNSFRVNADPPLVVDSTTFRYKIVTNTVYSTGLTA
jgi:hypothetical protein